MRAMSNNIEIKKLSFNNVFNNFSISFPIGKLIYVSGPNNCGKTTLIRTLSKKISAKYSILISNKELDKSDILNYNNTIECIIPKEIVFNNKTVGEEINNYNNSTESKELIKKMKLTKLLKTNISKLEEKNKVKLQLLLSLLKNKKYIFMDNIMSYFNKEEVYELNDILKEYIKKNKATIIITTIDLNNTINSDYLVIIYNNEIVLEGEPLKVLEKDNIINKVGLDLPFMIDLSSKLKDYDLIKEIELDKERLINKIWK